LKYYKALFSAFFFTLLGCGEQAPKSSTMIKRIVYVIEDTTFRSRKNPVRVSYIEYQFRQYDFVDIGALDSTIKVDLRYGDTSNFLKKDFYNGLKKAFFPCEMATKICNAQHYLRSFNPSYSLLILDATRPFHVQKMMWDSLDMEADKKYNYLAPPFNPSLHNYGCAVDVTIYDNAAGKALDMGSAFDHFGKLSEPVYEWQFLKSGELSREAYENRLLLRKVMQMAKLNPINSEWWHFNLCSKEHAAKNFALVP
jgi:zinc D-Ala-D-Ala dipeptidase